MNRCRHDIAADVLRRAVEGPARLSHLARAGNLPLDRARVLVAGMVEAGLLYYDPESRVYEATELAYEWLRLYEMLRGLYDPGRPRG